MATIGITVPEMPHSQRVVPGSVNIPFVDFQKIKLVKPEDIEKATEEWVESFNKIIKSGNFSDLKNIFLQESFWRDHMCLAWDYSKLSCGQCDKALVANRGYLKELSKALIQWPHSSKKVAD